jgi:hypothetical protein
MNAREIARIYDIVTVLGLEPARKTWICPFPQHVHHNNTPSLGVDWWGDRQRFKCFGNCGLQGDVIDAVGYTRIPGYNPGDRQSVNMAIGLLQSGFEPCEPTPVVARPLTWDALAALSEPGPRVLEYAARRGLSRQTLHEFSVREKNGALAIPVFHYGTLMGVKYRATWEAPAVRYWSEEGSRNALFNYARVYYTDRPLLVVKGEIPVMLLHQHGILACCTTSGEGSAIDEYRNILSFSKRIVVVGDNDADLKTRRRMQAFAKSKAETLKADLRFPPEQWKDIDQWILEDAGAIGVIRQWLEGGSYGNPESKPA